MISLSYPLSSLLTNKKISRFNFLGERKRANERERERGGQKKDYERGRKRVREGEREREREVTENEEHFYNSFMHESG